MKRIVLLFLAVPLTVHAQGVEVWPRHVIDMPTAWTQPPTGFDLSVRAYGDGGALIGLNVGISNQFTFGASYGGTNILGEKPFEWNRAPGLMIRYILLDSRPPSSTGSTLSYAWPDLSIGFESQGYGAFNDSTGRYANKSRGFYVVASQRYEFFQNLDFHGGVNYSLERGDRDSDINFFFGTALAFNQDFELLGEYDFAFNDDKSKTRFGTGNGYLNAGLRLRIRDVIYLEVFVKNMTQNRRTSNYFNREFKITYFQFIDAINIL
jgi:hypothetical protein